MFLKKINTKVAKLLDMPSDSADNRPKLTMNGREEFFCGGCKGIRLYTESEIRFVAEGEVISVRGCGLSIKSIDEDEIILSGKISTVDFI